MHRCNQPVNKTTQPNWAVYSSPDPESWENTSVVPDVYAPDSTVRVRPYCAMWQCASSSWLRCDTSVSCPTDTPGFRTLHVIFHRTLATHSYTTFIHLLKRQHNYTQKNESKNLTNQQHETLKRYLAQLTQWHHITSHHIIKVIVPNHTD